MSSPAVAGAACQTCQSTEQQCAFHGGNCCQSCTHWDAYTLDGQPLTEIAPVDNRFRLLHGTEDSYWQHRDRREPICGPCVVAHLRYKGYVA